jgi:hypothetical protein
VLPYFVLGVALLVGLLLAGRWFVSADPKVLVKVLKWAAVGVIAGAVVFFVASGRLNWALLTLPAFVPWFLRLRQAARMAKNYSRMSEGIGGAGQGRTSTVETRFLRMTLDHGSGAMDGVVKEGPYTGRGLAGMSSAELLDLLEQVRADEQSARVLEAYLDRVHGDWRTKSDRGAGAEAGGRPRAEPPGGMTRKEAYEILGLKPGAGEAEIKEAHRRLIAGLHPDHGGSNYLAAKVNRAKDVLLGG